MHSFKKVLAVIASEAEAKIVLPRVNFLSQQFNTQFVVMRCIRAKSDSPISLIDQQRQKLEKYLKDFGCPDNTKIELVVGSHPSKLVIKTAKRLNCDLIVKACERHDTITDKFFTPYDWQLLRYSPISTLLVKDHKWPAFGNIVSAVGIGKNTKCHNLLNESIVKSSAAIGQLLKSRIHLSNAILEGDVDIKVSVPHVNVKHLMPNKIELRKRSLHSLLTQFDVKQAEMHILEGLPEDVVPNLCDKVQADLLVIGSLGRKGLKASFIGNAAELIIDKVDCDTLVIKSMKKEDSIQLKAS